FTPNPSGWTLLEVRSPEGSGLPSRARSGSCWYRSGHRAGLMVLGGGGGGGGKGVEQVAELGEVEGLGEVGQRAAGQQAADDTRGGLSGEDHDRDASGDRLGPEFLEDLLAVDVAQVEIEQQEVGNVPDGAFEAGPAGRGGR